MIQSYEPTDKQKEFHSLRQKFKAFIGGFGSGKTKAGIWEGIDLSLRYPGNRIAIFRDTMPDLRDSTMQTFFEECPQDIIHVYRRRESMVVLVNGSEILFRSFRAYKSASRNQNESKIKSLNLGGFYVDEGNEITKNEFMLLSGRLRLDAIPKDAHQGWLSTNPPNTDHWIYETFDGPHADKKLYGSVHATSRSNPHLPSTYVTDLEKQYSPSWVKKFLDGEYGFMTTGDPVYADFNAKNHCIPVKHRLQYGPVHRYWDFGFHRPAVVWAQVDGEMRWKILKEYMGQNMYIEQFASKVIGISNEYFPGSRFLDFCDPAGNQKGDKSPYSSIEILKKDFKIEMQFRFSLITEGLDLVQRKLCQTLGGEPAFQINSDECPILVSGFEGGYAREKVSDGRAMSSSEPIKDGHYEHLHDALRYGAVNVFGSHSGEKKFDIPIQSPSWGQQAAPMTQPGGMLGWQER